MGKLITGIHHITAIAADSQTNMDFYTGILGIRLVKKTVNFDAPDVYHFYYGDELVSPEVSLRFSLMLVTEKVYNNMGHTINHDEIELADKLVFNSRYLKKSV